MSLKKIDCKITNTSVSTIIKNAEYLKKLTELSLSCTISRNVKINEHNRQKIRKTYKFVEDVNV